MADVARQGYADLGNNGGGTTTLTAAYTVGSNANRCLLVGFVGDTGGGADDVISVTYNGVAMTLIKKQVTGSPNRNTYLYGLMNPASGSNNVVITCGSSHYIIAGAVDYYNVNQARFDNSQNFISAGGVSSLTSSLPLNVDRSWVVCFEGGYDGSNPSPGAGSTGLCYGSFGYWGLFDSNAIVTPPSSYSMTTNRTSSTYPIVHLMVSLAPATGTFPPWLRVGAPVFNTATSGTTVSVAWSGNIGDLVVIGFSGYGPTPPVTAVLTDTAGFSFSTILTWGLGFNIYSAQWQAIATAASDTLTVTIGTGGQYQFWIGVAGYSATGTISQDGAGAYVTPAYNSGQTISQAAAGANELAVSFVFCIGGASTSSTGWYFLGEDPEMASSIFDNLNAGGGTVSLTYSNSATYNCPTLQLFKAGSPPPAGGYNQLMLMGCGT